MPSARAAPLPCDAYRDPYEQHQCVEDRYYDEKAEEAWQEQQSWEAVQTWEATRYEKYEGEEGGGCYPIAGCE